MNTLKQVIGKRLLIEKLNVARESQIVLPDATIQKSLIGVIRQVGTEIGDTETLKKERIVFVSSSGAMLVKFKDNPKVYYFVNEADVLMVKHHGHDFPFGNRCLIKRINDEVKVGSIIIPACYTNSDQSLFGIVEKLGVSDGYVRQPPFDIGDCVHIQSWDIRIREVEIGDAYYLVVPYELIDYKCKYSVVQENFSVV